MVIKYIFILLIIPAVGLFDFINPGRIEKRNTLVRLSKEAYLKKKYISSVKYLEEIVREFGNEDDKVYLDSGHNYFLLKDIRSASFYYNKAARSEDKKTASLALQQLGVIARGKNDFTGALRLFKEALKTDFRNETARYNYELMKKVIDNREEKKKADRDEETDNREQGSQKEEINFNPDRPQNDPQQQKDSEGDEEKESLFLNREQAQTLLESIKREEMKYIQQIQRKSSKKLPAGTPER